MRIVERRGAVSYTHLDVYKRQPLRYAERHGLTLAEAQVEVKARTQAVEGTLNWYCLDYWSRELALDIMAIKREIEHLIAVHPHAPVSYTHLDVYKRQGLNRPLLGGIVLETCLLYTSRCV